MIKERVDPSLFQKIIVADAEMQSELIAYLEENGLVQCDSDQKKWIGEIPIEQFIII